MMSGNNPSPQSSPILFTIERSPKVSPTSVRKKVNFQDSSNTPTSRSIPIKIDASPSVSPRNSSPLSCSLSPVPFPTLCLPATGITRTQSTGALRMLKKNLFFQAGRHSEEMIVTPFAQLVHSLKSVKSSFLTISKAALQVAESRASGQGCLGWDKSTNKEDEELEKMSTETLEELEWCLEQLQIIQTHRSVSEIATNKFKKLLNKELLTFAGSSKAGNQISEYISSTFLDKQEDNYVEKYSNKKTPKNTNNTKNKNNNNYYEDNGNNKVSVNLEKSIKDHTDEEEKFDGDGAKDSKKLLPLPSDKNLNTKNGGNDLANTTTNAKEKDNNNSNNNNSKNSTSERKSPMLEITGVKRPSITPSTPNSLPKYGVSSTDEQLLDERMGGIDRWGLDIFEIGSLTNNRPLTATTYHILMQRGLLRTFNITPSTLLNYLLTLEDHYRPETPYHNSYHAADVTQSAHVLLNLPVFENLFTDLEILSTIFACSIHDVDHPGLTNNYFINTGSDLALMYNDESVLENHHLAVGFKLLQQDDCNFLASLPSKSRQTLRRNVISIVLATDMNKHMEHVAHLKAMVEAQRLNRADILNQESHVDLIGHLVHCADLSNPTKPLPLYQRWLDLIMEEFFRQGDLERTQELDISPMCDRLTATVEKYQVGFIDYIVHPLWDTLAELVQPGCQDILETLEMNRDYFFRAIPESSSPFEGGDDDEEVFEETTGTEGGGGNASGNEEGAKSVCVSQNRRESLLTKGSSVDERGSVSKGDAKSRCSFVLGEEATSERSPTRAISSLLTSTKTSSSAT